MANIKRSTIFKSQVFVYPWSFSQCRGSAANRYTLNYYNIISVTKIKYRLDDTCHVIASLIMLITCIPHLLRSRDVRALPPKHFSSDTIHFAGQAQLDYAVYHRSMDRYRKICRLLSTINVKHSETWSIQSRACL